MFWLSSRKIYNLLRLILATIQRNQGATMSAITDLQDAVTTLADDVATEIAELAAAVAASGGNDPAIVASVERLKELSVALKASVGTPPTTPEPPPV